MPPGGASGDAVRLEIRYNATCALAHRGSKRFGPDHVEILGEMLDEQQQLKNFRVKMDNKQEYADVPTARLTVDAALKASAELKKQRTDLDLQPLYDAIATLTGSEDKFIRRRALETQKELGLK